MKNLIKFAALGAALAVSAISASATTMLTGSINIQDSPDSYTYSGGVFAITSISYSGTAEPNSPLGGVPALSNYSDNLVVGHFNTSVINGLPLWEGSDGTTAGSDVVAFIATSWSAVTVAPGLYEFIANGYFTDTGTADGSLTGKGLFANTFGSDDITYIASGGNLNEDFSAAPEPSSLMLLGTGLTGAAGMFFRRRRSIA